MTDDVKQYLIRMPWPSPSLSPNTRVHRLSQAKVARKYRGDAMAAALEQGCRNLNCESLTVDITFYPPDRRRRDTDNMLASIKSGLDGIVDAVGVDDSNWHYILHRGAPIKHGAVVVHVIPSAPNTWRQIGALAKKMTQGTVT